VKNYHIKVTPDLVVAKRGNYSSHTKCIVPFNLCGYMQIKSLLTAAVYTKCNKIYSLLCVVLLMYDVYYAYSLCWSAHHIKVAGASTKVKYEKTFECIGSG
jgi:hypothetical protein